MNKFFCFYCQQDVEPRRIVKWKFCPNCKHYMSDDGSGFYRVCDNCEANMPSTAKSCLKCGYNFATGKIEAPIDFKNSLMVWFTAALGIIFALVLLAALLYISFYLLYVALIIGGVYFLYNLVFRHFLRM